MWRLSASWTEMAGWWCGIGTQALARVMVEAESEEKMQALTAGIAAEIQKALGT